MTHLSDLAARQKRVVSISDRATVRDACKSMAEANVGACAILDGGRIVGLFTERDVLKRVLLKNLHTDDVLVKDVMTTEIVTAQDEMTAREALHLITTQEIRHLPVLDAEGRLIAVLSIRDLILDQVDEMKDYIALAG
ncbi:MAG: CBS domain-containing protein [Planctomycetes bacterium]|jgi:CBS domain-containing protein|nr:CBS domain-containing protein [Planctomycetota bacterium]MBT4028190.1 CBS domain-containing protein [Planctomycetota bacterium]MBT4559766.1 CBS domain-containing protein [Planctomycetota bacterium]MBT5101352.1 CBS domain-containing protein [Planctomycetota bacterium]MBT5120164.1 CBS domain-containing protein [Planctomycetota bacterium]